MQASTSTSHAPCVVAGPSAASSGAGQMTLVSTGVCASTCRWLRAPHAALSSLSTAAKRQTSAMSSLSSRLLSDSLSSLAEGKPLTVSVTSRATPIGTETGAREPRVKMVTRRCWSCSSAPLSERLRLCCLGLSCGARQEREVPSSEALPRCFVEPPKTHTGTP